MIVASFFAPRPHHKNFEDYGPYLRLLEASCRRHGHLHIILTDVPLPYPSKQFISTLPSDLMVAAVQAQLNFLDSPAAQHRDIVLVGADCVIAGNIEDALKGADAAFTSRCPPKGYAPINTGAIYVRGGSQSAAIWRSALARMEPGNTEWGDDQWALCKALDPVPLSPRGDMEDRLGLKVRFLPMRHWNYSPEDVDDATPAAVLHFKGTRKKWMADYCRQHLHLSPVEG